MGTQNSSAEHERRVGEDACPVCRRGEPTFVIATLESSWLTMGEEGAPLPGACALFFRRHAVELHELTPDEGAAYMRDLQRASRAIHAATGAAKMNYEIHGNTIPHLHTHLFPRRPGDRYAGRPIDPRSVRHPAYALGEFDALRRRVLGALAAG